MPHRVCLLIALTQVLAPSKAEAQFDEGADLIPGLAARYSAGEQTIERIDVDLAHDWQASAPDPRLPEGPFAAEWTSGLLLREEGKYTFHAYLAGAVSVELDGELVLEAERDQAGWVSGDPVELDFGLLDLVVNYQKTSQSGRMQIFWSSDRFPLEPLPSHQLFREDGRPDLALVETGRKLFAAHRCNRCHVREHDPPAPPAPELTHVTSGLQRDWLVAKLLDHNPDAAHAKMPSFGFTADQASAVAAWITHVSKPIDLKSAQEPKRGKGDDAPTVEQAGMTLLHSVGCLACHQVNELGESGPFGGGDLSQIGRKRSAAWINTWLAEPEKLNPQHRMPVIKLSTNERALLTAALSRLGRGDDAKFAQQRARKAETELVKRGRRLAEAARCAACHKIPELEADLAGVPSLADPVDDWDDSCLAAEANRKTNRPVYPRIDGEAVKAFVNSRTGTLSPPGLFARGRHVLEERNCLGCHERDLTKGIVPTAGMIAAQVEGLRGQSEALIPPALTAVGDKLYDEPLAVAVSGKQEETRLPWLLVRMPKFEHTPQEMQDLVGYLIGHDRIPAGAPASRGRQFPDGKDRHAPGEHAIEKQQNVSRSPHVDPQTLVIGRSLAGSGGFNCVACHKFGDYEPRNVALGTKGSDLKGIDRRLRPEFFHRWTRDPLRVIPGVEMPSIKKPVDGVFDEDLDRQLTAIWEAINDPEFTAPPNPAQVEQHVVLQPGDAPRIVRDVFTVSEGNGGGYVARGLAMGFDNGHSLLFDLDTFSVRGWTFGDFAQQRTEGKSWYWDLAGVEPLDGFDQRPDVTLLARNPTSRERAVLQPVAVKVLGYFSDGETVRLSTELTFVVDNSPVAVPVVQMFRPWSDPGQDASGISRTFSVGHVPGGYVPQLTIDRLQGPGAQIAFSTSVPDGEAVPGQPGDPTWTFAAIYRSSLANPALPPKPRPELPGNQAPVTTLPGFTGRRLPLPTSIMPTSIAFRSNVASDRSSRESNVSRSPEDRGGPTLVFTSLKGHVFLASDSDGDGLEDALQTFEEGLAAPFGILPDGDSLLVAHKPELLRLRDLDGDGKADERMIVADGWGYTDNYHDWTTGPVRDRAGNLYLALGSDYQQHERPAERSLWRGKVLKVDPDKPRGERIEPFAHELRFPQGIAIDDRDRLFVTDQQGVANTFNEINHIIGGRHYGVEAMHEEDRDAPETRPAIQVPHPWTRSVNGLIVLPPDLEGPLAPFAGHAVGAEYNSKFLIRASFQEVGGELQGATYYLSRPEWDDEANTFLGPMAVALAPGGDLYVGSIFDSGWLGGQNTGEIVRLTPNGDELPNGIREVRAMPAGFEVEFLQPVDRTRGEDSGSYSISGYTRVWEGSYATPDSGRYSPQIESVTLSGDGRTARLVVDELRETYVYEVNCGQVDGSLFPATGHYTMNRVPPR